MAYSRLPESEHATFEVLADGWMKVELTAELAGADCDDVLVADLFLLDQSVALVDLSVRAHETCELLLDL